MQEDLFLTSIIMLTYLIMVCTNSPNLNSYANNILPTVSSVGGIDFT